MQEGSFFSPTPCPCGSGVKAAVCCGRYHRGADAPTAEALMRSRYSAYAVGDIDHLLRTWHPATRPDDLDIGAQEWVELRIVEVVDGGEHDDDGIVEFVALFDDGPVRRTLRERSSFGRYKGRWMYVGAEKASVT